MSPNVSFVKPGESAGAQADILLHHLHGAMDAGGAGRGLIDHLLESLPTTRVATFDSDALVDYRSHRPWLHFENWSFTDVKMPQIALDLLRDDEDRSFLILHGPEPDFQWEAFVEEILALVQASSVKQVVSIMGMPAGVPHTRPTPIHYHSSCPQSLPEQPEMLDSLRIPAGINQLLEYRLGQEGIDSSGIVAAIPYYLSDGDYPPGSAALARALAGRTSLALPLGDLEAASTKALSQINQLLTDADDSHQLVQILEKHYDAAIDGETNTADREESIPTADEIGARLEEFLVRSDQRAKGIALGALDRVATFSKPGAKEYQNIEAKSLPHPASASKLPPKPKGRHRAEPE